MRRYQKEDDAARVIQRVARRRLKRKKAAREMKLMLFTAGCILDDDKHSGVDAQSPEAVPVVAGSASAALREDMQA